MGLCVAASIYDKGSIHSNGDEDVLLHGTFLFPYLERFHWRALFVPIAIDWGFRVVLLSFLLLLLPVDVGV